MLEAQFPILIIKLVFRDNILSSKRNKKSYNQFDVVLHLINALLQSLIISCAKISWNDALTFFMKDITLLRNILTILFRSRLFSMEETEDS